MSATVQLLWQKIAQLRRMRGYLAYSLVQVQEIMPIEDWSALTPKQHETLAAFRLRFSEFQEHLGKAMSAIAREEEQSVEIFSRVLLVFPVIIQHMMHSPGIAT